MLVNNRMGVAVPLTSGEWEVLGWNLWVDEERQLVYFMGLRETPLEKHLYVVSLRRPGEVRLLTRPGFSYSVDLNKECTMCVVVYSNIQKLPACQVFRITHSDWSVGGVNLTPIGFILEPSVYFRNVAATNMPLPIGAYNPVDGIAAPLNSMYLSEGSVSEVETAVRRLMSTNAAGVDEIPFYKFRGKHLPENYRPISILSSSPKILESIVCQKLVAFLEINNILSIQQHGFRQGKSTNVHQPSAILSMN
ncbi:dipeptidylpeptidase [Homalodisca vitripennis]|nr:dipeptidylpeptidase [Homalodisca vitripennis]